MSAIPINQIFIQTKYPPTAPRPTQLHEYVSFNPQKEYSKNIFWSKAWTVATYTSMLGFAVFAGGAIMATYVLAEIYVPLTLAALLIVGRDSSTDALNWMYTRSNSYAEEAKFAGKILAKFNAIKDDQICDKLYSLGISFKDITNEKIKNNPTLLKSLIARFEAYIELKEESEKQAEHFALNIPIEKENEPSISVSPLSISPAQSKEGFALAQFNLEKRESCLQTAASYNVYAAYALKILLKPDEERKITDYFTPLRTQAICHIIAGYSNNPHSQDMLITKAGRTYTREEIRQMHPINIAKQIFKFPSKWFW